MSANRTWMAVLAASALLGGCLGLTEAPSADELEFEDFGAVMLDQLGYATVTANVPEGDRLQHGVLRRLWQQRAGHRVDTR